jgi:hypothetical protein
LLRRWEAEGDEEEQTETLAYLSTSLEPDEIADTLLLDEAK